MSNIQNIIFITIFLLIINLLLIKPTSVKIISILFWLNTLLYAYHIVMWIISPALSFAYIAPCLIFFSSLEFILILVTLKQFEYRLQKKFKINV